MSAEAHPAEALGFNKPCHFIFNLTSFPHRSLSLSLSPKSPSPRSVLGCVSCLSFSVPSVPFVPRWMMLWNSWGRGGIARLHPLPLSLSVTPNAQINNTHERTRFPSLIPFFLRRLSFLFPRTRFNIFSSNICGHTYRTQGGCKKWLSQLITVITFINQRQLVKEKTNDSKPKKKIVESYS